MLKLKTKTINAEKVAQIVRHLLHDRAALPTKFDIWHIDEAAARFDPTSDEYFEALAVIVHLAREMIRLDRVDREFDAADHALGIGVGHAQPR